MLFLIAIKNADFLKNSKISDFYYLINSLTSTMTNGQVPNQDNQKDRYWFPVRRSLLEKTAKIANWAWNKIFVHLNGDWHKDQRCDVDTVYAFSQISAREQSTHSNKKYSSENIVCEKMILTENRVLTEKWSRIQKFFSIIVYMNLLWDLKIWDNIQ